MKVITLLALCLVIAFFTSGCLVTKGAYDRLLSEKAAADSECRKLKKKLSIMKTEKDKEIAEQMNRITTLGQEIMALQAKYEHDMKLAKERQEDLAKGLQALRQQSSEDKKMLLSQIEELSEKYEKCKKAKNPQIDALKARRGQEAVTLDEKGTFEGLFNQLEEQLKDEIEKGEIRLERRRTKIK